MRRLLAGVVALCLTTTFAFAQSGSYVRQSGASVTPNTVPYWVTNGVIGGGVTAADSPVTSFGVTTSGQSGICANSARESTGGWLSLCQGYVSGVPTISVQNYGTASAQPLQFIVNGTTYAFPGSLADITIGVTPVVGGTNSQCLYVSGGVVGQQTCTLSAITSLTGDGTATGPGSAALTLATVNANTGTFGSGSIIPIITVNGKGLITAVTTAPSGLTIGSSTITSGATNALLYQDGTVLGEISVLGNAVLSTNSGGTPSLSTTLPTNLTIPGPTFSGTVTFPDAATWTSTGISKAAALSVGSATLPSSGDVSISGQYQVNGTQIAASNLSNGITGSGSVVLAASPTLSGTVAGSFTLSGNLTLSGNDTHSGQTVFTGTSAPSSTGGNTVVMGTIIAPSLANNGQAFLYNTSANGAVLQGEGSTYDSVMANKAGAVAIGVGTGTTVPVIPGLSSGTCSSGLALNSSNDMILVSCPGAASSIQVGSTTISSGTSNYLLYNNAGTLGNETIASLLTAGTGISITGTTDATIAASLSTISNALAANVSLNNTSNYFDGPSTAQGTSGTWHADGTVTVSAASSADTILCKLWDGTTVIASSAKSLFASETAPISLSGDLASPVANIKISCKDSTSTNGLINFNASGNSKDSVLTVERLQ